jgi:lipopolysaccharide/colanic/teichoic acid biosynthesis glycosyltransferase
LWGDMSLVGPRPALPREVAVYDQFARRRLETKPGLTCLWQVAGRADLPFPKQLSLDIEYIESRSLWFDLKILAWTVPAVVTGRGAY